MQALSCMQALREHCSLSGHDPGKNPRSPKQNNTTTNKQQQSPAPVQPAVPLTLTVQPEPDQVEMDRYGACILFVLLHHTCTAACPAVRHSPSCPDQIVPGPGQGHSGPSYGSLCSSSSMQWVSPLSCLSCNIKLGFYRGGQAAVQHPCYPDLELNQRCYASFSYGSLCSSDMAECHHDCTACNSGGAPQGRASCCVTSTLP